MTITVTADGALTALGKTYRCALGRTGMIDAAQKREGDGATPTGHYPIRAVYYRADRVGKPRTALPVFEIKPDDGWCDAPDDPNYNKFVQLPYPASAENLWRDDHRYDVLVVLGHNDDPIVPGAGSCIFWHVAAENYAPTQGCVAMDRTALLDILSGCTMHTHMVIAPQANVLVTQNYKRTSALLQGLVNNGTDDKISIGTITDQLGDRAFGLMIFLLAFPNALPMPPGFSAITGVPLVILALQYLLGRRHPHFPEFIRKREMNRAALAKAVHIITPALKFLETLLRPRLAILTRGWFEKLTGCVILFLALILMMPLPGANMLPALTIAIIALGVIERDGLVIGIGTAMGVTTSVLLYKIGKAVILKIIGWIVAVL